MSRRERIKRDINSRLISLNDRCEISRMDGRRRSSSCEKFMRIARSMVQSDGSQYARHLRCCLYKFSHSHSQVHMAVERRNLTIYDAVYAIMHANCITFHYNVLFVSLLHHMIVNTTRKSKDQCFNKSESFSLSLSLSLSLLYQNV
jgi:hypothetical protein